MNASIHEAMRIACAEVGILFKDVPADGRWHETDIEGDRRGKGDGRIKLFPDGEGGIVVNWKQGEPRPFFVDSGHKLTPAEKAERDRKRQEAIRQAKEDEARQQAEAAAKARAILDGSTPAPDDHPYLASKGIKAHGLMLHKGSLVIPMCDAENQLHSLQFIDQEGEKRFLKGGRKRGCFHFIKGESKDPRRLICEGFATGASLHEATGLTVIIAFDAGNLLHVAQAIHAKLPDKTLILCADEDTGTPGNPGLTKATEAARAVGGLVALPDFAEGELIDGKPPTDMNDLARLHGPEAVQRAIAKARPPDTPEQGQAQENATGAILEGCNIAYRRMADIQAKPIRWLWPGRFARGKVSMLAGNPGLGKSQVTASMAAVVTTGRHWPVDRKQCEVGNVVFLSAEDDPEDTIRPRLEAAGADLSRVFILDAVVDGFRADGGERRRAFNMKSDLARLAAMLEEIGDVALIVIDPITAYLGDTDSHVNAEIRALLAPLGELAAKHGAAVVCVTHLNKGGGGEALMRVTGSLAFVAAARAAFIVVKDKEDEARRLFLPLKNNIGKDQSGLAFSVEGAEVDSPAGLIQTSRVIWEAGAVTISADEAMAPAADAEERSSIEDAKAFLLGILADRPMPSKAIRAEAEEAGHAWRTIQRAQKALEIEAVKEGMKAGWVWKLPPKNAKEVEDCHTKSVEAFGDVGNLRQPSGAESSTVEVEL